MALKRWDVTVNLAHEYGFKSFAEIGVKAGKHVAEILKRVPDSTVVAVDPWAEWSLRDPKGAEQKFDAVMAAYPGRVTKHKLVGVEASYYYEPGSFDYVFIDDDHTHETFRQNLTAWLPKVRKGGILAGHDYCNSFPGVDKVLHESFDKFNVEPDHVWWVQC